MLDLNNEIHQRNVLRTALQIRNSRFIKPPFKDEEMENLVNKFNFVPVNDEDEFTYHIEVFVKENALIFSDRVNA